MKLTLESIPVAYRYISCAITSILYLADASGSMNIYKIIVILMLWTMTVIINGIYLESGSPKYGIVIFETIGLTLLLIPTGGLDSPFIWYALNTVLLLERYRTLYSWLALSFYLSAGTIISTALYNPEDMVVFQLLQIKTDIILVFVLIIIAIRFLTTINRELNEQANKLKSQQDELIKINKKLICANAQAEESIKHVMSLYQIMKVFSGHQNSSENIYKMVEYANEIIGSEISLSWTKPELPNNDDILAPIKSSSKVYGYLIIKYLNDETSPKYGYHSELIQFLAELIVVVLERNQMEKVASDLAILEEQKRIANEIHDNVSQRIFSVVCAAHSLNTNYQKYNQESIREKLLVIDDSVKEITKELKAFIYRLSPEKNNMRGFYDNVNKYLNEFAALNNVKIEMDLCGEAELLGQELKLAMIRIIREASGNAVRHGECTDIKVKMRINSACCSLMIKDNGIGFCVNELTQNHNRQGLGVNNMKTLTKLFNGRFHITSLPGSGTTIKITIPVNRIKSNSEKEGEIPWIS
ncbi:MAG: hypothetical protein K0R19_1816 [Bacillota bacterium]|jgi:signal transduction histidine kinase|nr:hypothetical protein [Bacillota bacterium]